MALWVHGFLTLRTLSSVDIHFLKGGVQTPCTLNFHIRNEVET